MWRSAFGGVAVALTALTAVPGAAQEAPILAAQAPLPKTAGWELIMRCVICHSVEIAVQQRFGPQGWSDTLDRMIRYGAPIPPEDKQKLMTYLLQHYRDPNGR